MAKKGGKQPGAGRPKGATTKPRLSDYLSEDKVKALVSKAIDMASMGDTHMLKFCLEQHFGKAAQAVDVTTNGNDIGLDSATKSRIDESISLYLNANSNNS